MMLVIVVIMMMIMTLVACLAELHPALLSDCLCWECEPRGGGGWAIGGLWRGGDRVGGGRGGV